MVTQTLIEEMVEAVRQDPQQKNNTHSAIVSHVDDEGIVWVNVAGSEIETPTASASTEVKRGDAVMVEWRNDQLYIAGNYSNPSAGVTRVMAVENEATRARVAADAAVESAQVANEAASAAQQSAEDAETAAGKAQTSADNASEYAARALGNLSTVQSVTETLNWITSHGTMTKTDDYVLSADTEVVEGKKYYTRSGSGTAQDPYVYTLVSDPTGDPSVSGYYEGALDPTHVYFVQDNNGDYTVGGVKYAIVPEPNVADIGDYYVLSIDESLNNYVATHLSVTSEGLWIIPDAGGNKVLIATGSGSDYTTAGTYIISKINGADIAKAMFLENGVIIGQQDETHAEINYNSLKLIDKEGNIFFYASDLRDEDGNYTYNDTGDGTKTQYSLPSGAYQIIEVKVNGVATTDYTTTSIRPIGIVSVTFDTPPANNSSIAIKYEPAQSAISLLKAFTFGTRRNPTMIGHGSVALGRDVWAYGANSVAEGYNTTAQGDFSHAEGYRSVASGYCSHAEGNSTAEGYESHSEGGGQALGDFSHAQGSTTANYDHQTTIGCFNNNQSDTAFEIGNGIASSRSNAFAVKWDGSVSEARGTATGSYSHAEGSGTASGYFSHAGGQNTIAAKAAQTVVGRFNEEDTASGDYGKYAFIVGIGQSDNDRFDGFNVDWYGNLRCRLYTGAAAGTTDGDLYAAITALGWQSEVID